MPIVVPPRADLGAHVQALGPGGSLPPGPPPPQEKLRYKSPHSDPRMRWGGFGPLAGFVLQNPPGKFQDGGAQWSVVADVWGNQWLLLLTLSDGSPAYAWDKHPHWEAEEFFPDRTQQEFRTYCDLNAAVWYTPGIIATNGAILAKPGLDLWKIYKGERSFSADGFAFPNGPPDNDTEYVDGVILDFGKDAPIRFWKARVNLWTRQAVLVHWLSMYSIDEKEASWRELAINQFSALVQGVLSFVGGNYVAGAKQVLASLSGWYDFAKGISDFNDAKGAVEDQLINAQGSGQDVGNNLPGAKAPAIDRTKSAQQLAPQTAGTLITQRASDGGAADGLSTETIVIGAAIAALLLLD